MSFQFATCDRNMGLRFLRKARPSGAFEDTPESAGPFLDLIVQDVIRIQDPDFHPACEVVPGKKWSEDRRSEVVEICTKMIGGAA